MSFVRCTAAGLGVNFHSVERVDEKRHPDNGDAAVALACASFGQLMAPSDRWQRKKDKDRKKKDFLLFECGGLLIGVFLDPQNTHARTFSFV